MNRRSAILGFFLAASAISAEDPVKIGIAGPLTGGQAKMGNDILKGVSLAVEEWNAKGGVLGRKVEIVKRDDEAKPQIAKTAAKELVNERVVGVIGHFNSGCTEPASETYKEKGVVMITPSATNPRITDRGLWNVFRVCGRDNDQGKVGAEFALKKLGVNRVAVLHDKTTYGKGLADEFKKAVAEALPKGVVFYDGIPREEKDFKSVLSSIKEKKPDLWYFGGIYDQAGPLVLQAREIGLTAPLMSGDGTIDPEFLKSAGPAAEGSFLTFGPDPEKIPTAKRFLETYQKRHGEVGPYSVYAYDAAHILLGGIQKAGAVDGKKVADAIRSTPYEGSVGRVEFDSKGDIKGSYYVVWTVKNGKFVLSEQ